MRKPLPAVVLLAFLVGVPVLTEAHPLAPALLELHETEGGRVEVLLKTALSPSGVMPLPVFPERCRVIRRGPPRIEGGARIDGWSLDCGPSGLSGARIGMANDRDGAESQALLSLNRADGSQVSTLLGRATPFYDVPEHASALDTWGRYAALGVEHLLTGLDHLLFVLGLVLWLGGRRALLIAVTAFTLGHSVTLALATLGYVTLPPAPVELGIAVSILYLAVLLSAATAARPRQGLWQAGVLPASFGLLHGLGFAGALREVGLPAGDIPLALFGFNIGLELAQLGFVAVALLVLRWVPHGEMRFRWVSTQLIGTLAAFWCWQRGAGLLS